MADLSHAESEAVLATSSVHESDNPLMEAVLLLGSGAATLPGLLRGLWRYELKRRLNRAMRAVMDYKPHPLLYLLVALAAFGGLTFAQSHQLATGVMVNGTYTGAVANQDTFRQARSFVQTSAKDALGYQYDFEDESLRTFPVIVANNEVMTEEALVDEICEANSMISYTNVLTIDGRAVGADATPAAIETALMDKLNTYRTENTISAEFTEDVFIGREIISKSDETSFGSITEAVNATSQEEIIYTVKAGDTWSQIANGHGMTSAELLALNPGYDMDKIWLGQELTVSAAVPLLSVKTVDRVAYQTALPYETEWKDDNSMYRGESRVITKGINGTADVQANVSYIDGVESNRDVISSTTVKDPVNQVVAVGTKERPKTMATGSFAWPTHGRISSPFGYRASPGGIGSRNHKGIDIAAPRGTAVKASDGGTVSFAGWMNGYGYTVIINHGNGYETRYAHNSALTVSVGTKVYKGQQIAKVGSTGNSTGNHCHFEIRHYGTPVNPLKYL